MDGGFLVFFFFNKGAYCTKNSWRFCLLGWVFEMFGFSGDARPLPLGNL